MWFQQFCRRYLERKGWIVFWLDDNQRECRAVCWLHEYLNHKQYTVASGGKY